MAGNMGNEKVTVSKLSVVKIISDKNLLLVKGSVPGPEGKLVTVKPSRTKVELEVRKMTQTVKLLNTKGSELGELKP